MKFLTSITLCLLATQTVFGQRLAVPPVDNSTYTGKAMFGYQGWFAHPDDNSPRPNYWHYGNMDVISRDNLNIEMFPDLREMCSSEKYPTAYTHPNGETAYVFSSGNKQTVMRHMKWVRDYNTDGVFMQRFISEYNDRVVMAFRDSVTTAVMEGCEKYGRVFSIMYDGVDRNLDKIKEDWMHMVDDLGILNSDSYLQHEGRPLVALWGFTFYSGDATVEALEDLIDWFHNSAPPQYQASIKLGLNDNWFTKSQEWLDAFAKVEVISPWSVGRFSNKTGYNSYADNQLRKGSSWCINHDILFVPVLWPGFSWHNLKDGEPKNQIPRDGGDFFWMQVVGAYNNHFKTYYFAMLDELDESTAFFKTAENSAQAPAQQYWLNLDADGTTLPSDWYLRCAGEAAEILRGNINISYTLGTPAEGIMTIIPDDNKCSLTFIFPDFENENKIEISLDGGTTYPYSTSDDVGSYVIPGLQDGRYDIFVRHPGSEAVPMGPSCINSGCTSSGNRQLVNSANSAIKIFPNPLSSGFEIKGIDDSYQIEICDVSGKVYRSFTYDDVHSMIDISTLPDGIYLVTMTNEHNRFVDRIIKMHD
ncbi:MAG: T9SS type A sorting domain-containing protein [Bacteroidota bacterium]